MRWRPRSNDDSVVGASLNRGFSLLEALIALAFLAMATLAVLATFLFSSRLDSKKEARHQAALLAVDAMEEARAILVKDLQTDVSLDLPVDSRSPTYKVERRQAWVGESAGLEREALKEVTVRVSWRDSEGSQTYPLVERFVRPR